MEISHMSMVTLGVRRPFDWRLFLALLLLIVIAGLATLPISLMTLASSPPPAIPFSPVQIALLMGLGLVICGAIAAFGQWLAGRIGLGAPILDSWSKGEPVGQRIRAMLVPALLCGLLGVVVVMALDVYVFLPHIEPVASEALRPPAWQGFLLSIHAGIVEEVLFRLFLLTFLAWLGSMLSATAEGRPTAVVFWTANLLAALLFGLAHLPTAAALGMPLDALVVIRVLTLNGLLGLSFGWLYRRYGLESAIVAHMAFDFVIHGFIPLLVGG
jgi:membrane protease YdiL (CAAX protease family)